MELKITQTENTDMAALLEAIIDGYSALIDEVQELRADMEALHDDVNAALDAVEGGN